LTRGLEAAHVKAVVLADGQFAVVNLVSSATGVDVSMSARHSSNQASLVLNARVAAEPGVVEAVVAQALAGVQERAGLLATRRKFRSLAPGRPTPTHRYA
ncbi:MAG: GTP-binding protein, partial [Gemmataceae bacterium]